MTLSASAPFNDSLSQVQQYMQQAQRKETFQGGKISGYFYSFADKKTAQIMSAALAVIGIVGASGNPKFVAQHIAGDSSFGVILTEENERTIKGLITSKLSLPMPAAAAGSASIASGNFPILSVYKSKIHCVYCTKEIIQQEYSDTPKHFLHQVSDPTDGANHFLGCVMFYENNKWVLHVCPGGAYAQFSEQAFNNMMPHVIRSLEKLQIWPDHYCIDGRHPGDTERNFEAWMKKNCVSAFTST